MPSAFLTCTRQKNMCTAQIKKPLPRRGAVIVCFYTHRTGKKRAKRPNRCAHFASAIASATKMNARRYVYARLRSIFRRRFGGSFVRFRCRSGCNRLFCRSFFSRFVFHRRIAEFAHFHFLSVDFNFVQDFDIRFMTDGALVSSARRQRA